MEKFLAFAKIAWNPVGAARSKVLDGSFTVGKMLAPYVGIVIACNLLVVGAQKFYIESLQFAGGGEMPDHPLLENNLALQFLSVIQVLAPLAAIAILPARMFHPSTRSAVLAAVLAVAAASAFYGAAFGVPAYMFAGMTVTVDPELGVMILIAGTLPGIIVQLVLIPVFWFRTTMSVLGISGAKALGIIIIGAIPLVALIWFTLYIAGGLA
jgi:hypothetical protein